MNLHIYILLTAIMWIVLLLVAAVRMATRRGSK